MIFIYFYPYFNNATQYYKYANTIHSRNVIAIILFNIIYTKTS